MEQAVQLFGYLILVVLGFILPIMVILLSVFHEGMIKLAAQYETERKQSENNIKEQFKKMSEAVDIDESAIKQSIEELKSVKKTAEIKLSYLNPKKQIVRLFIPLIVAFLAVVLTLLLAKTNIYYSLFLIVSIIGFAYVVVVLWKLISIIVEVRKIFDTERRDMDRTTIELLSALVKKTGEAGEYYLRKVYINLEGTDIKNGSYTAEMSANIKKELKISIRNREDRMAKNVQIGLCFPTNFIIDKNTDYSIYRDEKEQIVRHEATFIHANTNLLFQPLAITPLKRGDYEITTFIKAENIESIYKIFSIRVS